MKKFKKLKNMKVNKKYYKKQYLILQKIAQKPYRNLINVLSDESIDCICESIYNLLDTKNDKKFNITENQIKKIKKIFKKNKKLIRKLTNENVNISKKRKVLNNDQLGKGIFSIIASIVLPALLSLIKN